MPPRETGSIRRAAVIGAGTMGHGIAQVLASAGITVAVHDSQEGAATAGIEKIRASLEGGVARDKVSPALRDATLRSLRAVSDFREAVAPADLVIEAIPENLEQKRDLFARLGAECREDALLASNTSSLSITRIASEVPHPKRVVGLHFFNPAPRLKFLEIVQGRETGEETLERALSLAQRLGYQTIVVRDSPGFATSRLGLALGLEAMRMLEEKVASAEDIDRAMVLGYGHPMGPLRVSDLVGLDVRLSIAETLYRELGDDRFKPPRILREKVAAGKLGRKSGEGFHRW
jgi:3-hydroxybutyryl-CoA dehydrogenase